MTLRRMRDRLKFDLGEIRLSRFVEPHAAAIPKGQAGALVHLRHLFPIIQGWPTKVGHPVHLSFNRPVPPLQHRITTVFDFDEAINDAVSIAFAALQQVMGTAVAFE